MVRSMDGQPSLQQRMDFPLPMIYNKSCHTLHFQGVVQNMNRLELIKQLAELERRGIFVLLKRDIDKLYSNEDDKSRQKSLQRMVNAGLLTRAAKGVYVNPAAASRRAGWVIEELAKALRPGQLSYVSLESILSEYGIISQIPMSRLSVMTTGVLSH